MDKPRTERKDRVRDKLKAAMEAAEKARKKELFRKRIEVARQGVRNYQQRKHADAAKAFRGYLRILEDGKGVSEGGLTPSLFDAKDDLPELLLISGVYWDLMKLYDRTTSDDKRKEFAQFVDKFVLFSKGMPYQPLSAETLRKYIATEKPLHIMEFKNAYKALGGGKCFVATSLIDVSSPETIVRLRKFRDETLEHFTAGRAFIRVYYRVGPRLASRVDRLPQPLRKVLGRALDRFAQLVTN